MRNLGSLARQVEAAVTAGYRLVEPLEHHLNEEERLEDLLREYSISAPTAHISLPALKARRSQIVDDCLRCGIRELFVHIPQEIAVETMAYWTQIGTDLGAISAAMQSEGIALGFHNSSSGFKLLVNGQYGFEVLFNAASGSPLIWQADIAWLHHAGVEPRDWLRRFSKVLTSAHIKDRAADSQKSAEDGWANVGAGIMVWPSLWRAAVQYGARTLVIEHDNPPDPIGFAKESLSYVRRFY
ncbi:hypothetical protein ATY77_24945 [Rhizobium sp. R634]|nr:hypothetical protein ATY77_24945 [Rhizobium sp. R634]